jgi:hypothetical protein
MKHAARGFDSRHLHCHYGVGRSRARRSWPRGPRARASPVRRLGLAAARTTVLAHRARWRRLRQTRSWSRHPLISVYEGRPVTELPFNGAAGNAYPAHSVQIDVCLAPGCFHVHTSTLSAPQCEHLPTLIDGGSDQKRTPVSSPLVPFFSTAPRTSSARRTCGVCRSGYWSRRTRWIVGIVRPGCAQCARCLRPARA